MNADPNCPRPDLKRHDTFSAYKYGCRCTAAREDARLYHKRRREGRDQPRRIDPTGTRRRIQALRAIGYDKADIARRLGVLPSTVGGYLIHKQINWRSAQRIVDLYDELSMTLGPSARSRALAKRMGWPPPLAWDDDTIDDPTARPAGAITGRNVDELAVQLAVKGQLGDRRLSRVDAHEAIRRMRALGLSTLEIARRANISARTVHRQGHEHTNTAAA